jgi:UDP-GlcNAc:undecaprenyl-phosphate/decaprenyl-phosphate GlcNAc-1-phosphate transferase
MWLLYFKHFTHFSVAFFFSFYLVPILAETARKRGLLDEPDGKIKKQKRAVPYLGGVAVYLSFIVSLSLLFPFENNYFWLVLGGTWLLFIGLIDDLNPLRPHQKFIGQFLATLCFLKGGLALKSNFFSQIINFAGSGFWILSVINAFNLVDVMDGLAVALAAISTTAFLVIALFLGNTLLSLLLITLLGALLGFFAYNKPPARIYLGDAGSLFVGGLLAAIPLLFPWSETMGRYSMLPDIVRGSYVLQVLTISLIPILLVGIPLLEVSSLIIVRIYHGIPVYLGSPHHFSSYLQKKGWSKRKVLGFTCLKAMAMSACALLFLFGIIPLWVLLVVLLAFSFIWFYAVFL